MRLNEVQTDALTEVVNIGVGRAAASLSQLIDERIKLSVPNIKMCNLAELTEHIRGGQERLDTLVAQDFSGVTNGRSLLGFTRSSSIKLAQILAGCTDEMDELDSDLCGILEEVGNIVLNAVLGSFANMMGTSLNYSVPVLHTEASIESLITGRLPSSDTDDECILIADAHFEVARLQIDGSLVIAFELDGIDVVLSRVINAASTA